VSGPRVPIALLAAALAAPLLGATASTPAPPPRATEKPAAKSNPPLDFSGTWDLDVAASKDVLPTLEAGLTLIVRQSGNRIWLEPTGPSARHSASESLIADGRPRTKDLGRPGGRGTVTATWSPDGRALLLEITSGDVVQRSRWTMSPDRKTWWRHTVTHDRGQSRETGLAFRKRSSAAKPAPTRTRPKSPPAPTPAPG
jgi:hypothetical protein